MFRLLRYFSLTPAAEIVFATGFVGYVYYQHEVDRLIAAGESQNVHVARVVSNALLPKLQRVEALQPSAQLTISAEAQALDEAIKKLAKGLPIIKVKFYSVDGHTRYSSELGQIGEDKSGNPDLLSAARDGKSASKLTHRDQFSAFPELVTDREVLETYSGVSRIGDISFQD